MHSQTDVVAEAVLPGRYVFHEVRVPLNTVLLAVNMAVRPIAKNHEFSVLEGSLSMMSKVLNDVLDLFVRVRSGAQASQCMRIAPPAHRFVTRTLALDDAHQSVDTLGMLLRRGRFALTVSVLSNLFVFADLGCPLVHQQVGILLRREGHSQRCVAALG
ncbi:hypothetical protein B0H14DRAFT_3477812 [Mycena olivaceomarginata]|nr:hypothetical protein B0H14DRAFT_3477812 [Mycena olivaceomarginata]